MTTQDVTTGEVLFAGGVEVGRVADAELYRPATRAFTAAGAMCTDVSRV